MSDAPFSDAITNYIRSTNDGPAIVTGYVIYAEYLDADGDMAWLISQPESQTVTTSLGQVETLRRYLHREVDVMLEEGE